MRLRAPNHARSAARRRGRWSYVCGTNRQRPAHARATSGSRHSCRQHHAPCTRGPIEQGTMNITMQATRLHSLALLVAIILAIAQSRTAQGQEASADERARETEAKMTDDERFSLIISLIGPVPSVGVSRDK